MDQNNNSIEIILYTTNEANKRLYVQIRCSFSLSLAFIF